MQSFLLLFLWFGAAVIVGRFSGCLIKTVLFLVLFLFLWGAYDSPLAFLSGGPSGPYLGAEFSKSSEHDGLDVVRVDEDSPASRIGLTEDDVVLEIWTERGWSPGQLDDSGYRRWTEFLEDASVGESITLVTNRIHPETGEMVELPVAFESPRVVRGSDPLSRVLVRVHSVLHRFMVSVKVNGRHASVGMAWWIALVGCAGLVGGSSGRAHARRMSRAVVCSSCGWKGTFGRFSSRSGCPNCGSDLFNS